MDDKGFVVGIFLDLFKAFDSPNHNIFHKKTWNFGIRDIPLKIVINYLNGRTQSVCCNKCTGVPQGFVLGPILFLIYVNDVIYASSKLKFTIYADDTTILFYNKNLDVLHRSLSHELNSVNEWIM